MPDNTLQFVHQGKSYALETVEMIAQGKDDPKVIRVVQFQDRVPAHTGLKNGVRYCLVELHYDPVAANLYRKNPGYRQYWDFYPFQGEHIREILLLDDRAKELQQRLQNYGVNAMSYYKAPTTFMMLEPLYAQADGVLQGTCKQKLSYIYQCGLALQEFYRFKICKKGSLLGSETVHIMAHRDMKWKNALLEYHDDGSFTVRLIDFATLYAAKSTETTKKADISPENTAPEDLLEGQTVSSATDVWALGAMLGELFGNANPLSLFRKSHSAEQRQSVFQSRKNQKDPQWMEQILGDKFWWKPDTLDWVKILFRQALCILPSDRIGLEEFLQTLEPHVENQTESTRKRANPYCAVVLDAGVLKNHRKKVEAYIANMTKQGSEAHIWAVSGENIAHFVSKSDIEVVSDLASLQTEEKLHPGTLANIIETVQNFAVEMAGFNGNLLLFLTELPPEMYHNSVDRQLQDFGAYASNLYVMLYTEKPCSTPNPVWWDTVEELGEASHKDGSTASSQEEETRKRELDRIYGEIDLSQDGLCICTPNGTLYVGRKKGYGR